jgi:hypothetical protein
MERRKWLEKRHAGSRSLGEEKKKTESKVIRKRGKWRLARGKYTVALLAHRSAISSTRLWSVDDAHVLVHQLGEIADELWS